MKQIADERADLLRFLQAVEGDAWSSPTVCTDWCVKDVLAHLVDGELNVGRIYRGEVRELGSLDPSDGIARWQPLPGAAVRAALWQHGTATQRVLDQMTPDTWRAPISALGCRTVGQLVRLHLFDLAVHGHDLTEAINAAPVWEPRLPFLVEFVVRAAPSTLRRRGAPPSDSLSINTAGHTWTIDGRADAWQVTDADADAELRILPEDLVLAVTGRAMVDDVLDRSETTDRAVAKDFLNAWQVLAR